MQHVRFLFLQGKNISLDEAEIQNLTGTITIINQKIMKTNVKINYLKGVSQKTEENMHDDLIFNYSITF